MEIAITEIDITESDITFILMKMTRKLESDITEYGVTVPGN